MGWDIVEKLDIRRKDAKLGGRHILLIVIAFALRALNRKSVAAS